MRHLTIHPLAEPFALLSGTIIGVGIFGLPYLAVKSGLLCVALWFIGVTILVYAVSYAYNAVIIGTNGRHRLPGYVGRYLGHSWKQVALATTTIGVWGSLLTYVVVGGQFVYYTFSPLVGGSEIFYTLLFFMAGVLCVILGARTIARTGIIIFGMFIGTVALLAIAGLTKVNWDNVALFNPEMVFAPYGLVLFALWGVNVLPDVADITIDKKKNLNRVVLSALIISAAIYFIFTLIVVAVCGPGTTTDALSGLAQHLGQKVMMLGFIFGILATFTSFIGLGLDLRKVFQYDYGYHKIPAIMFTAGIPLALYLSGIRDTIILLTIIGAVVLGIESIMIFSMYARLIKERGLLQPVEQYRLRSAVRPLIILLCLGAVLGIITPFLI